MRSCKHLPHVRQHGVPILVPLSTRSNCQVEGILEDLAIELER